MKALWIGWRSQNAHQKGNCLARPCTSFSPVSNILDRRLVSSTKKSPICPILGCGLEHDYFRFVSQIFLLYAETRPAVIPNFKPVKKLGHPSGWRSARVFPALASVITPENRILRLEACETGKSRGGNPRRISSGKKMRRTPAICGRECAVEMLDKSVRLKSTAEAICSYAEALRLAYGNTSALPSDVTFSADQNFRSAPRPFRAVALSKLRPWRSAGHWNRRKTRSSALLAFLSPKNWGAAGNAAEAGDKRVRLLLTTHGFGISPRAKRRDQTSQANRCRQLLRYSI